MTIKKNLKWCACYIDELIRLYNKGTKPLHEATIGHYLVDFLLEGTNIIIECDSDYWHNLPGRPEADKKKTEYLENKGYIVHRIPELIIKDDYKIQECINHIVEGCC